MYLFHFVPVIPFLSPVIWCPKTSLSKGYLLLFIFTDCTCPSQHLLEALVRALLPTEISSSPSITKFHPFVMPLEMVFPPLPREVRSKLQSANSSGSLQGLKMHRTRKRFLGSRCCSATLRETGSQLLCVMLERSFSRLLKSRRAERAVPRPNLLQQFLFLPFLIGCEESRSLNMASNSVGDAPHEALGRRRVDWQ